MALAGIIFHEAALGGPEYDARDERVWELLEELSELTRVYVIGDADASLESFDVTMLAEEGIDGPEGFEHLETQLSADAGAYLYIDPDKTRLKAAKKAGFLTHRLVSAAILDERLRAEKILD